LYPKDLQPKTLGGAAIRRGESHSLQEAIHKLEREEGDLRREIVHLEGSTHKCRRRKTPSEGKP
jgi:predicted  nucleic acid-binding Zn-ribbon protein